MKRILLIFAIVFMLVVGTVAAQVSLDERGYLVYIPSTYVEDEPMPLVIALHGYGDTASAYAQGTGWTETAEEYGFIVGFLNGYEREWNVSPNSSHDEDDTAAVLDFIDLIKNEASVDSERIYLVGFSNGAAMTHRIACEAPHTFAAIVAVSGWMYSGQDCAEDAQTSVLVIHGISDTVVPFAGFHDSPSVPDIVAFWAETNHCIDEDVHEYDEAYTGLQIQFYQACDAGNMVMLYAIPNFGHTWPGANQRTAGRPIPNELNANFIIWGFFEITYQAQQAAIVADGNAGD